MAEQTIEDLGKLVKAKYPQYAQMPDVEVGRKVKAKYPQYATFKDVAEPTKPMPATMFGRPAQPTKQMSEFMAATADKPVLGGPVLPVGATIPTVIGMGTERLGNAIGLPEWMNVAAGLLAGGLAGGAQGIVRRLRTLDPSKRAEAEKIVVGLLPKGDKINKLRTLLGNAPEAPEPFKPSPSIASKIRFGGPTEPELQIGKTIPRGKFTPPTESAPKPYEPVRPNPNIARKLRFGGTNEPEYSAGRNIPRRGFTPPSEEAAESVGSTEVDLGDVPEQYRGGVVETAKKIAKSREAKVTKIADLLRKTGLTPEEQAAKDPATLRKLVAKRAGYNDMSETSWEHLMREIKSGPVRTEPLPPSRFERP